MEAMMLEAERAWRMLGCVLTASARSLTLTQ